MFVKDEFICKCVYSVKKFACVFQENQTCIQCIALTFLLVAKY